MQPFLSEIYIYPIKSLAGIAVKQWPVIEKGLLYDRQWMLVDHKNIFLSQRQLPRMALIKIAITEHELILTAPQMQTITVPLQNNEEGERLSVQIWNDTCMGRCISLEIDEWFSEFLKIPCRLVYQPNDVIRPVDPHYAVATDKVNFSDGFPFLIISEASLTALNQAMGLELSMQRFRPNLVISACEAYAEDSWRQICIGDIGFRLPKPCSRCAVPSIDPETAEKSKEPLATLNRLRKWQNKVYFGQNALHNEQGILNINDKLVINATGTLQPPL